MTSDQTIPVAVLRDEVREFIAARDWNQFHTPKDLAIGLITEASELLELFRFRSDVEIDDLLADDAFNESIRHELADCLYFVLAISNKLEIDLTQALREKMAISANRYPVQTASGRNVKYTNL